MSEHIIETLRKLDRIDRAGYLKELEMQLAHDRRGMPKDDLHAFPDVAWRVDHLAKAAHCMLGDPLESCMRAATEALILTKRQQAIELIERFYNAIVEQETKTTTSDKLARERAFRKTAWATS